MKGETVTVLAGGWSASLVDLRRLPGFVIAVNDAATFSPRWDLALSMDRLWAEERVDVLESRVAEDPIRRAWIRRNALQNLGDWAKRWPFIQPFECDHESQVFTAAEGRLNGTNSGMCALNLAWKRSPARVYLLGFDMNRSPQSGQPYWYPPYPWANGAGATTDGKYARWSKQFDDAAAAFKLIGCEVFNISPTSSIKSFPKITPAKFYEVTT